MSLRNRSQYAPAVRGEFERMDRAVRRAQHHLALVPVGARVTYDGATAPEGWVLCNGAAYDRTMYSELFGVLGVSAGTGNGTTTFNVPSVASQIIYTGVA